MTDKNKSTTKRIEVRGKAQWAKVFEQNRDMTGPDGAYESHGGACTVDALLDEDNLQLLVDAGSQTAINTKKDNKVNEDGLYIMKLKRKWDAPYTYGGAPVVRHADGVTNWDIDEDGLIGNGSECVFHVSVYTVKGRVGTRLDALQVIDHIPYESDYVPGPKMRNYAKETPAKPAKENKKVSTIDDDEIPF